MKKLLSMLLVLSIFRVQSWARVPLPKFHLTRPAQGASVGYRIAIGPQAGQPVRRIKTSHSTWPAEDDVEVTSDACVKAGGYSVHAATENSFSSSRRANSLKN